MTTPSTQDFGFRATRMLTEASRLPGRNLQMPGDGRYQPADLQPYLGYDQWAGWLIIVEWAWLLTLAKHRQMPQEDADLLTDDLLWTLLSSITTTEQDAEEKKGNHDILALLARMRQHLPERLHRWLHLCATSYDIISTAYALQMKIVFAQALWPKLLELDAKWRQQLQLHASTLQQGRTHLQTALPVTVGFWLAGLHSRFADSSRNLSLLSPKIPGKFSGAVGTSASQRVLLLGRTTDSRRGVPAEKSVLRLLGLPAAPVSTQIAPPEGMARFYFELVLLSGALANLGEDVRILQMPEVGELTSASSTSSAMSHKASNPIAAENLSGMHWSVIAEDMKSVLTLVSDLQRDLRNSSVMRSHSAVMVYAYQQVLTALRLFKSLRVNPERCAENLRRFGRFSTAELLHLELQRCGFPEAHRFVNEEVVPMARQRERDLSTCLLCDFRDDPRVTEEMRAAVDALASRGYFQNPSQYLGDAVQIADRESENAL